MADGGCRSMGGETARGRERESECAVEETEKQGEAREKKRKNGDRKQRTLAIVRHSDRTQEATHGTREDNLEGGKEDEWNTTQVKTDQTCPTVNGSQ